MTPADTARALIAAGDVEAVARLVEALEALADKVSRFNGVSISTCPVAGRAQGEMWFAMKSARRLLATLPTAKEG